jgi:soluble lytic murein transglycosylase-like protein
VFPAFPTRFRALLPVFAVLSLTPCARAMEHITLSNGFSYDCAHHETVGDRTRLYTSSGDANYQEISTAQITAIEALPDPPKPVAKALLEGAPYVPTEQSIPELLTRAGVEHHIDVALLFSVIKAESNFHTNATSRAGARGLMQLMPGTARDLGVTDITSAGQNIAGGAAYLDDLLTRYKDDARLALAAYNAGPEAVDRYHGVPPYRETRAYVNRVISEFNRRKANPAAMTVASR